MNVKGIVIMTVAARPKTRPAAPTRCACALRQIRRPTKNGWRSTAMRCSSSSQGLRERLLERHRQIGPAVQLEDLKTIDAFDVRDRIATSSRSCC